jgi:signal transduction histidine kinase
MPKSRFPYWVELILGGIAIALLVHALFAGFDPLAFWVAFASTHDKWELDELTFAFVLFVVFALVVAVRHQRDLGRLNDDLRREVEARRVAEKEAKDTLIARDRFFAAMSHDLRTPVNSIRGFAEMMHRDVFGPMGHPKYAEYATDIYRAAGTLDGTISQVLDVSRLSHEKGLELVEVATVLGDEIRYCCETVAGWCGGERLAEPMDGCEEAVALLDRNLLRRYLTNLLTNSIKYAGPDAEIGIRVQVAAEGGIAVTVYDTGVGVDAEQVDELTAAFNRCDHVQNAQVEGTGLGLWIASKIAEAHGCGFTIASGRGQGFAVTLTIPDERVVDYGDLPRIAA